MPTVELPVIHNSAIVDDMVQSSAVHHPPVILFIGELLERKGVVTLALEGSPPAALSLSVKGLGSWTDAAPDCPTSFDVWATLNVAPPLPEPAPPTEPEPLLSPTP